MTDILQRLAQITPLPDSFQGVPARVNKSVGGVSAAAGRIPRNSHAGRKTPIFSL
jgi:hypothetical protein